jgi:stage II sporulation protein D
LIARRAFVTMLLAGATAAAARADDFDPAISARSAELRVLLGSGEAIAQPSGGFTYDGRPYRGTFVRRQDGTIVNTLRLEQYLYSVVPHEMVPSWPAAALQAQAVCARTYVLQRSDPRRDYDVVPSELDQVYGGVSTETFAGSAAVDATAGLVLRFSGQFALAMYSSCCGGHTESSNDAWGGGSLPYLSGVTCTTCKLSPYYRWSRQLDLTSVAQRFAQELAPFGAIQGLFLGQPDASGRIRNFELRAQHGSAFIKGSTFRLRVGPRALPSLLISKIDSPPQAQQYIAIEGAGLGHGVGLCQWGARGLAFDGASYSDILRFYFPGTEIDHD